MIICDLDSKSEEKFTKQTESFSKQSQIYKQEINHLNEELDRINKEKDYVDNAFFITKAKLVFLGCVTKNKEANMKMNEQLHNEMNLLKDNISYPYENHTPNSKYIPQYETFKSRNTQVREYKTLDYSKPYISENQSPQIQKDQMLTMGNKKLEKEAETQRLQIELKRMETEYEKLVNKGVKTTAQKKLKTDLEIQIAEISQEITNLRKQT